MKKMSSAIKALLAFAAAFAILWGCGGGGGGGTGGGNGGGTGGLFVLGSTAPRAGQYLEFIVSGDNVDPCNLRQGITVQVQAVNYDVQGNRTVLNASNWLVQGGTNGNITITQAGVMTVNGLTGLFTVRAQALVGGQTMTLTSIARATNQTNVISGTIRAQLGGQGLKYFRAVLYANGSPVACGTVGDNGLFRAYGPTNVSGLTLDEASVDTTNFYKSIRFNAQNYPVGSGFCLVPIGGAGNVGVFQIPEFATGPPPPPTGCGP